MKRLTDQEAMRRRVHKVIGQCNGIERMVERGEPCEAILLQISAALSALHRVGQMAFERRLRDNVREGFGEGASEAAITERLRDTLNLFCAKEGQAL